MYNISDKGINLLINNVEQQKDKFFWVRSADFQQQLYISNGFEKVWRQANDKLFEHPLSFVDAVIKEDNRDILKTFEQRVLGNQAEREQTLLARIRAADQSIVHWRDSCFCLCDTYGNIVGVAGIGEVINESEWYQDLEGKVDEPSSLELIKHSEYSRYVFDEAVVSPIINQVEIPCRRVKSRYYVLLSPYGEAALSRREIQCVYFLLAGMTAKQTARELKLSPRVIEEYLNNTRVKLHCKSKMEIGKRIKHLIR